MEVTNSGGRPKNDWTSARLRRLARLYVLSNMKVKTMQNVLMTDDGFKPCLRDIYKQLNLIMPRDSNAHTRRRGKLMKRAELKNACAQLKPQARTDRAVPQRRSTLSTNSMERLLAKKVIEDQFYNPLAHWDYFPDAETSFVTIEQLRIGNNDNFSQDHQGAAATIIGPDSLKSRKDIRKRKLRSIISHSELSFVASLLSSGWSRSSLHTRVLSNASTADRFCDQLVETPTTWNIAHSDTSDADICYSLLQHLSLQPQRVSLLWRPCCGLNGRNDSKWTCRTCGFSAILFQARSASANTMYQVDKSENFSETTNALVDILNHVRLDPILSGHCLTRLEMDTIASATIEFLEQSIQMSYLDQPMEHYCNNIYQLSNPSLRNLSNLSFSQLLVTDRFGNTALHHAAAAQNFDAILTLLNIGVPAEAVNTSSQTFLHLLDARKEIVRYIEIIRYLMRQNEPFPFFHKDNYGITIAHRFLLSTNGNKDISPEHLSEIQSVLGNQDLRDSQGYYTVVDIELDFSARFSTLPMMEWARGDADLAIELDKNGDTCLIAILKEWPEDGNIECLIDLINQLTIEREVKANVNAYDLLWCTALSIAARKGLFLAVERLLDLGANPNATNRAGESVMIQASNYRRAARKANDSAKYTTIFACQCLLFSRDVVRNVNATDEIGLTHFKVSEAEGLGAERDQFSKHSGQRQKIFKRILENRARFSKCLDGRHDMDGRMPFVCFRCGLYKTRSSPTDSTREEIYV